VLPEVVISFSIALPYPESSTQGCGLENEKLMWNNVLYLNWFDFFQGGSLPRGPVPNMAPQSYQGFPYPANAMPPQNGSQPSSVIYSGMPAGIAHATLSQLVFPFSGNSNNEVFFIPIRYRYRSGIWYRYEDF
jgi:hypothetical protein